MVGAAQGNPFGSRTGDEGAEQGARGPRGSAARSARACAARRAELRADVTAARRAARRRWQHVQGQRFMGPGEVGATWAENHRERSGSHRCRAACGSRPAARGPAGAGVERPGNSGGGEPGGPPESAEGTRGGPGKTQRVTARDAGAGGARGRGTVGRDGSRAGPGAAGGAEGKDRKRGEALMKEALQDARGGGAVVTRGPQGPWFWKLGDEEGWLAP